MPDNDPKENQESWVTIDLGSEGKAETQPIVEEPPETETPPETEETTQPPEKESRFEKRIKQLTRKQREAEENAARLAQENEKLRAQVESVGKTTVERETAALNTYQKGLEAKLAAAEKRYEDAYDAGDKAALLAAQKEMNQLTFEINAIKLAPQPKEAEKPATKPATKGPQVPELPQATKEWVNKNPWFGTDPGKDRMATNLAIAISDDLIEEGYDPSSAEFYAEVESRLIAESPRMEKLLKGSREEETRKPSKSPVSGASRRPQGGNRVTLTQGDQEHARKLGVSNERFAAQKKLMEEAGDGYVPIVIPGAGGKR